MPRGVAPSEVLRRRWRLRKRPLRGFGSDDRSRANVSPDTRGRSNDEPFVEQLSDQNRMRSRGLSISHVADPWARGVVTDGKIFAVQGGAPGASWGGVFVLSANIFLYVPILHVAIASFSKDIVWPCPLRFTTDAYSALLKGTPYDTALFNSLLSGDRHGHPVDRPCDRRGLQRAETQINLEGADHLPVRLTASCPAC